MFKPGHYYVAFAAGDPPLGPFQTIPACMLAHAAQPRDAMIVQAVMHLPGRQADDKGAPALPSAAAKGKPQDKAAPSRA